MKLTLQQKIECQYIRDRLIDFRDNMPLQVVKFHGDELQRYKTNLEQTFSDTDVKREKIDILVNLLNIVSLLSEIFVGKHNLCDDYGRYTEMGLQLDPCNSYLNFWNGIF